MERTELADRLGGRGGSAGAAIISERDPAGFMRSFSRAASGAGPVFLANPDWRASELSELSRLAALPAQGAGGWLMVPSGGSGGTVKFARHDASTICAAVRGFGEHFGLARVSSVCVLPLHHVSGLMAWMRSALTGGTFLPWSWKDLEAGLFPSSLPEDPCLSLVPTQLQRLVGSGAALDWLRRFRLIFVGGGPAGPGLLDEAARQRLPISTGYGSTETAAMVAALLPGRFLEGERGCGTAMPHAKIDLVGGIVRVRGESVCRGYHPQYDGSSTWISGDLAVLGPGGALRIIGRADDVILTGGKKVAASEVEAALGATGLFDDVAVVGVPNAEWGEVVVACHPPGRSPSRSDLVAALGSLSPYKRPKRLLEISPWPRNGQGKLDRAELRRLASALA